MLATVVVLVKRNKLSLELFHLCLLAVLRWRLLQYPIQDTVWQGNLRAQYHVGPQGLPVLICLPLSFQLPEPTYAGCVMSSNFSLRGRTGKNGATLSESR